MENIHIKSEVEDNKCCLFENEEEMYLEVKSDYTSDLAVHPVKCEYVGENSTDVSEESKAISNSSLQEVSNASMKPFIHLEHEDEGITIKQEVELDINMQQIADSGYKTLEEEQQETVGPQLTITSVTEDKSHDQHVFKCKSCKTAFTGRQELVKHLMLKHRKNGSVTNKQQNGKDLLLKFRCAGCNKDYDSLEGVLQHWIENPSHKDNGGKSQEQPGFECKFCNTAFTGRQELVQHLMLKHTNNGFVTNEQPSGKDLLQKFRCAGCSRYFESLKGLHRHWIKNPSHKKDGDNNSHEQPGFKCNSCNTAFNGRRGLVQHLVFKHRNNAGKPFNDFICIECNKGYVSPRGLSRHWKGSPSHAEKGVCLRQSRKLAGKGGKNKRAWKRLKRTFKCAVCNNGYFNMAGLSYHWKANPSHKVNGELNVNKTVYGIISNELDE